MTPTSPRRPRGAGAAVEPSEPVGRVAERVGFEPTVNLRPRRISSAVLSTTQPPLRRGRRRDSVAAGRSGPLAFARPLAKCITRGLGAIGRRAYIGGVRTISVTDMRRAIAAGLPPVARARFGVGDVVRHRMFDFRGVVFDVDPVFANSDEWYEAIPEAIRPRKDQPFYHLLAENDQSTYVAYVSQQNLVRDDEGGPVEHPAIDELFEDFAAGRYKLRQRHRH